MRFGVSDQCTQSKGRGSIGTLIQSQIMKQYVTSPVTPWVKTEEHNLQGNNVKSTLINSLIVEYLLTYA